MICQKCQKEFSTEDKISFRASCPHCGADWHTCIHCDFFDSSVYNECRETSAERVVDKEKANYCDYFVIRKSGSSLSQSNPSQEAKKKLDELFRK